MRGSRIRGLAAATMTAAILASGAQARQAGEPSPEEIARMMEAAAKPGEGHKRLEPLVGEWDVATTMWMQPGAPPMTTSGRVTKAWELGGRYLREEIAQKNPMAEGEMRGIGYLGFQNGAKNYQGVWLSDAGTSMIHYTGTMSADGKTLTCTGTEPNPMGGPPLDFKMVLAIESPDRHTLTFFYVLPGQGEMKAFEMVHTRRR